MGSQTECRIKVVMSHVFDMEESKMVGSLTPYTIESWDSVNHMKLVVALEEEFDIKFDQEEIETLISFDIINLTISAYL
jgi:acyl carrier protein